MIDTDATSVRYQKQNWPFLIQIGLIEGDNTYKYLTFTGDRNRNSV